LSPVAALQKKLPGITDMGFSMGLREIKKAAAVQEPRERKERGLEGEA
jgi:hypothetical protein